MKLLKSVKRSLVVFALSGSIYAATFNIGWDLPPVTDGITGWSLYTLTGVGTNRTFISSTLTNLVTVTFPNGVYQFVATATNPMGESANSLPLFVLVYGNTNTVAITNKPNPPSTLQLK